MMNARGLSRSAAGLRLRWPLCPLVSPAGPTMDAAEKQPLNLHAIRHMFFQFKLTISSITYWAASH